MKAASVGSSNSPTAASCFSVNPSSFDTAIQPPGAVCNGQSSFRDRGRTAKGWPGGDKTTGVQPTRAIVQRLVRFASSCNKVAEHLSTGRKNRDAGVA